MDRQTDGKPDEWTDELERRTVRTAKQTGWTDGRTNRRDRQTKQTGRTDQTDWMDGQMHQSHGLKGQKDRHADAWTDGLDKTTRRTDGLISSIMRISEVHIILSLIQ